MAVASRLSTIAAVIPSGATGQSAAVDLTGFAVTGIVMPATWVAAGITMLTSDAEAGTFLPVHDAAGTEMLITVAASRFVALSPDATSSLRWVKLRSGTTATPVDQTAERALTLIVEPIGGA